MFRLRFRNHSLESSKLLNVTRVGRETLCRIERRFRKQLENYASQLRSNNADRKQAVGKQKASHNSRKHGLAAASYPQPAAAADIKHLASAICGDRDDTALLAQARLIAESDLVLRAVRAQKLAVIEKMRDPTIIPAAKRDDSLALAKARLEQTKLAQKEIDALIPKIFEKYKDHLPPMAELYEMFGSADIAAIIRDCLEEAGLIEEVQRADQHPEQENKPEERDEYEAMEAAAPHLSRLERYELRASSRLKGAIRDFVEIQRMRELG